MDSLEYKEGALFSDDPWKIEFDVEVPSIPISVFLREGDVRRAPCKHCTNMRIIERPIFSRPGEKKETYKLEKWTCPRVVTGLSEMDDSSTSICLDCLLEAAKALDSKTEVQRIWEAGKDLRVSPDKVMLEYAKRMGAI